MRQIDQEIIQATDELKKDVALTTDIVTGNENTVVEVSPGNQVRSPKKMIEDCYQETQEEIQQRFGSLDQAVNTATGEADRAGQSADAAAAELPKVTAEGAKQVKAVVDQGTLTIEQVKTEGGNQVSVATAQANRAEREADAAAGHAGDASTSADSASDNANLSSASKEAAAESQAKALVSQNAAKASEQAASEHLAQVDADAQKAVDAAAEAEASKTAAAASATSAKASEDAAVGAKNAAQSSANGAATAATAAEASATKAKASETATASSASQAESSATSAGRSATNALNSANKAKASETAAQQAASTAQASEHNSEENAASAKASETAAASSASTATQQADRSESEADRSEAAAEKINREGIPIGAIMPYYGSSAPMGWLGLTKGATISKADYPALFKHLTDQRKDPAYTNIKLGDWTYDQGEENWVKGFSVTGASSPNTHWWRGRPALTFYGHPENNVHLVGGDIKNISGKYLWKPGSKIVIRIETTVENEINAAWYTAIGGTVEEAAAEYQHPNTFNVYHSHTDIPISDTECYLPDAANNFIKGYEPTGTRGLGTFEQDAIRNITGRLISGLGYGFDAFSTDSTGVCNVGDGGHTGWRANTVSGQPFNEGKRNFVDLDTSKVVPTAPENVPKNLNCLWIIKAYDAVLEPEQLQAKAVIDQVNANQSDLLAVNGAVDRLNDSIGYALLDFGTVNRNTRYVQTSPFGNNTAVDTEAEVLINGVWAAANWMYSTGSSGGRGVNSGFVEGEGIVVIAGRLSLNSSNAIDMGCLHPNASTVNSAPAESTSGGSKDEHRTRSIFLCHTRPIKPECLLPEA